MITAGLLTLFEGDPVKRGTANPISSIRSPAMRPGPGQESIGIFCDRHGFEPVNSWVRVVALERTIADSINAIRIVETAGAPC